MYFRNDHHHKARLAISCFLLSSVPCLLPTFEKKKRFARVILRADVCSVQTCKLLPKHEDRHAMLSKLVFSCFWRFIGNNAWGLEFCALHISSMPYSFKARLLMCMAAKFYFWASQHRMASWHRVEYLCFWCSVVMKPGSMFCECTYK